MTRAFQTVASRFATPLALSFGLLAAGASGARADQLYGYSQQKLSNIAISATTGGSASIGVLTASTTGSGATLNGSGPSTSLNGGDVLQTFVGDSSLNPGENHFGQAGSVGDNTFGRGDALYLPATTTTVNSINVVSEAALKPGPGSVTGDSSFSLTSTIALTQNGTFTVALDYSNGLLLDFVGAGPGDAIANYHSNYTIVVKTNDGATVWNTSLDQLNHSLTLTDPGQLSFPQTGIPGSGSVSATSGTLAAGTYTLTISGSSHVALNSAVPEPTSVVMMGVGVVAAVGFASRRVRRTASRS